MTLLFVRKRIQYNLDETHLARARGKLELKTTTESQLGNAVFHVTKLLLHKVYPKGIEQFVNLLIFWLPRPYLIFHPLILAAIADSIL